MLTITLLQRSIPSCNIKTLNPRLKQTRQCVHEMPNVFQGRIHKQIRGLVYLISFFYKCNDEQCLLIYTAEDSNMDADCVFRRRLKKRKLCDDFELLLITYVHVTSISGTILKVEPMCIDQKFRNVKSCRSKFLKTLIAVEQSQRNEQTAVMHEIAIVSKLTA